MFIYSPLNLWNIWRYFRFCTDASHPCDPHPSVHPKWARLVATSPIVSGKTPRNKEPHTPAILELWRPGCVSAFLFLEHTQLDTRFLIRFQCPTWRWLTSTPCAPSIPTRGRFSNAWMSETEKKENNNKKTRMPARC